VGDLEALTEGEIDFAVQNEMVVTLDDLLRRRIAVGLFDIERAVGAAPQAARALGKRLGWTRERADDEARRFAADRMLELATVRSVAARGAA
jgi:glycerol-3-phosphate dehydrogenase